MHTQRLTRTLVFLSMLTLTIRIPFRHSGAKLKKAEFVFIVDRSGSMDGDRIDAAKEALLLLLKSLPVGCSFNVVSFGSSHQLLFPEGIGCNCPFLLVSDYRVFFF